MKNKLGLLLAAIMVLNTVSSAVFAFENPLTKYNLYDDTHPVNNSNRDNVMSDYYSNSLSNKLNGSKNNVPSENLEYNSLKDFTPVAEGNSTGRNQTLRDSSRNVYSNTESAPGWEEGPSFYPKPSFESIVEKYRRSDFAGCLQECISYVRMYPRDTLGFYYLAMCYTKVSDKDNAIRAYEKVIALNDNPMIVKYATNGRNCILENDSEKCYQNVNEPEYIYPYANLSNMELTPVDPEELVNRNLSKLKNQLAPQVENDNNKNENGDPNAKKDVVTLPFGNQDEKLDQFINAPYGNGLSPELNKQYKQLQLKRLQETINKSEGSNGQDNYNEIKDIQKFDHQKSDSETIKLAYDPSVSFENIAKDPDYIKQKQEFDELHMLLGNDKSNDNSDMMNLLPYMTEEDGKNLSPEVIQSMMMRSMMGDITL